MKDFDEILRKKLQESNFEPPQNLWQNIEEKLPKKKNEVVIVPFFFSFLKYSIAASISFLLGMGTILVLSNSNELNRKVVDNSQQVSEVILTSTSESTDLIEQINLMNETPENFSNNIFSSNQSKNANNLNDEDWNYIAYNSQQNKVVVDLEKKYGNGQSASDKLNENSIQTYSLSIIEQEEVETSKIVEIEENSYFSRVQITKPSISYSGWWLGAQTEYNSIFNASKHYSNFLIGMPVGYDFKNNMGLQSGIFYSGIFEPSQSSNLDMPVVIDAQMHSSINVPLLFRYKFTRYSERLSKPTSINLVSGVDYGLGLSSGFQQLGFRAGAEYDIFFGETTMLTLGFQGGFFRNYTPQTDNYLSNNKMNYKIGVYSSLRFLGLKKQK